MIRLEAIYKRLGGRDVLNGLDLQVERGETFVIVGPSGTGKSVTLNHIVGLLRPDRGRVLVDGQDVHRARRAELARIRGRFGVLFQSGALINWMSVYQNVALPLLEKTRLGDAEIEAAVQANLELVGLADIAAKMPSELSGGMRKRVGLARAIIQRPEIILYDEPTSGLDPVMSRAIDDLIRRLQREMKVTSIVVTHDLRSAFDVGDRIGMLYGGQLIEVASPEQFRRSPVAYVQDFIQSQFG